MPITETQLELRRRHIGSSDSPAILGVSPWATANDVFWSKRADLITGDVPEERAGNDAITAGNFLENSIISFGAEELGAQVLRNQFRVSNGVDKRVMSATYDALVRERAEAIEAKTFGVTWPAREDDLAKWGRADSDHVPDHYLIQCQHQIHVSELERVWLYSLIGGRGFVRYRIERNQELVDAIVERCLEFWHGHVIPGIPPESIHLAPPRALLKARAAIEGKRIALDANSASLVAAWELAKKVVKKAEQEADTAEAAMLLAIGDAETVDLPDGRILTRKPDSRRTLDMDAIRAAHPVIVEEFTAAKLTKPIVRISKARKGAAEL